MCDTITPDQRCYCYQHTYIPAGRRFAYYADLAEPRVVLVLLGLMLFVVDPTVTNRGLPTVGVVLALLAGGLALL